MVNDIEINQDKSRRSFINDRIKINRRRKNNANAFS